MSKVVVRRGFVLWLTGLSGAGKTTLADALEAHLRAEGRRVEVLDGDRVRVNLSKGLGFSREDRDVHVMRLAYVAHLLARNGVIAIVAAISPFRETRRAARQLIGDFVEIHVSTPLEECARRDSKGLYARARDGELSEFTGISQPYEAPLDPEIRVDSSLASAETCIASILTMVHQLGYL
jgi:adenylyl-sulfate kinase